MRSLNSPSVYDGMGDFALQKKKENACPVDVHAISFKRRCQSCLSWCKKYFGVFKVAKQSLHVELCSEHVRARAASRLTVLFLVGITQWSTK